MCEQLGMEPDKNKMPMDIRDMDPVCQKAVAIFNSLNDTFIPGTYPVYNGKDISGIPFVFDLFDILKREERVCMFEYIKILDGEAKKASIAAYDRATKKHNKNSLPSHKDIN